MELGERKLRILQAIIDDYITTAIPVGSRTISKKYSMGLSSATIRNEMSDLEDLGYLDQPHTSAGRIPSEKAYRLYVNKLMKVSQISDNDAQNIKKHFDRRIGEVDEIIQQTARVLSDATNYTSIVLAPQLNKVILKHIQLVPITVGTALAVIVTDSGIIKDTIIRVPEEIDMHDLHQISMMLTEKLKDHSLEEINHYLVGDLRREMIWNRVFISSILDTLERSLKSTEERDIVLGGASNILNYPEYSDIEKAKNFLSLLEEKEFLYRLLSKYNECEVNISIGSENKHPDIQDCSIVTATYRIGRRTLGSIGIIGPTRMKYSNVVSILRYMGDSLTQILTDIIEPE